MVVNWNELFGGNQKPLENIYTQQTKEHGLNKGINDSMALKVAM